jgi:hypothetical protein
MEKDNTTAASATAPSIAELEFRRYEARLGVWKVVLGTFIVGLAGILIPGAIQFYNTQLDDARRGTELRLSQQTAHQEYIKDFFSTAVNQDIELRIRFADYFANLSGEGQDQLWKNYLRDLTDLRDKNRKKINELEEKLVKFKKVPLDQMDNVEFDRINRELAWANKEIGYVPTERSAVIAWADSSPIGKKLRLYRETTDLVQRLTSGSRPLTEFPDDLERFWNLYRKDLIGVESSEFARVMIAIGHTLDVLVASSSPPNAELRRLADNLVSISRQELADISQVAVQQQQQQQQMPQQQQQQVPYPQ